uniref:hypothetical protein n=1 Tax=Pararhizobium sp. IMCC3301 TaxID=3067904 RepID=UPI0027427AC3|nr:hypothetical protein [Pararhizobium sp. IMCC3301]
MPRQPAIWTRMRHVVRTAPRLSVAFLIVTGLVVFLAIRLVVSTLYWEQHRNEPIQPWMTLNYVSRSHSVPKDYLADALDLPPDLRKRVSLAEVAARRGQSVGILTAEMSAIIAAYHEAELRQVDR